MKCPWCRTKIDSENQKKERWSRGDKTGKGFYQCPRCDKSLVHRYEVKLSLAVALFLAGVGFAAIPFGIMFFFDSVLGVGNGLSTVAGIVLFASLIGVLWFYTFQPVDVKPE